jgi:cation diffusion facilitator CzcD-associated flavoprotein CzcO
MASPAVPSSNASPAAPVVVVGAGPAGLAAAAELRRLGIAATVCERGAGVGMSWRGHYDHLRLHTARRLSHLPGLAIPRRYGKWVHRDDLLRYLERYAAHHRISVRFGQPIQRIERAESHPGSLEAGWRVCSPEGDLTAAAVVVATGRSRIAYLPTWPGLGSFRGRLVHAGQYRNPGPYAGRAVLVVGAGNSAAEIAVALARAGAARVWMAVRTPPNIVPWVSSRWQAGGVLAARLPPGLADRGLGALQRLALPDLSGYGLPRPAAGLFTRAAREEVIPLHDRGFTRAVRSGAVVPTAAVSAFNEHEVVLADGSRLAPEVVVAATGYRPGLEPLVGHLDLLDPRGLPIPRGAHTSPAAAGLYFVGYTNHLSGSLRYAGIEARQAARAIRNGLHHGHHRAG